MERKSEVVKAGDAPDGTSVFGSRFTDELKRASDMMGSKSRLVAQKILKRMRERSGQKQQP